MMALPEDQNLDNQNKVSSPENQILFIRNDINTLWQKIEQANTNGDTNSDEFLKDIQNLLNQTEWKINHLSLQIQNEYLKKNAIDFQNEYLKGLENLKKSYEDIYGVVENLSSKALAQLSSNIQGGNVWWDRQSQVVEWKHESARSFEKLCVDAGDPNQKSRIAAFFWWLLNDLYTSSNA